MDFNDLYPPSDVPYLSLDVIGSVCPRLRLQCSVTMSQMRMSPSVYSLAAAAAVVCGNLHTGPEPLPAVSPLENFVGWHLSLSV